MIMPDISIPDMSMPGMSPHHGHRCSGVKQVPPGDQHHGGKAATDDQPFPSKDRLQRIYPFVQSKLYRIQLDFSAPTDTPPALARNVP